jgi:hypothetical protein
MIVFILIYCNLYMYFVISSSGHLWGWLSWVQVYYPDRGENHGECHEAIKQAQLLLGQILDGEMKP